MSPIYLFPLGVLEVYLVVMFYITVHVENKGFYSGGNFITLLGEDQHNEWLRFLVRLNSISIWRQLKKNSVERKALGMFTAAGLVAGVFLDPGVRRITTIIVSASLVLLIPCLMSDYFSSWWSGPNPNVPSYAVTVHEQDAHNRRMQQGCGSLVMVLLLAIVCVLGLILGWNSPWPTLLSAWIATSLFYDIVS